MRKLATKAKLKRKKYKLPTNLIVVVSETHLVIL